MHGPQHQVKPAASSYVKCGSRAAVFTAKATSAVRKSDAAGPCFGQASNGGKREGMAETARSNNPGGRKPIDKVRRLQRKLWTAAKQRPSRRFHALYDRIHRSDVLWEAWERVRRNRGAAGVDRVTLEAVEEQGVGQRTDFFTAMH